MERLGYAEAKRLSVTGARFGAGGARPASGLFTRSARNLHTLEAAIATTIQQILACAPRAIAETKKLLRRARFEDPAALVEHAAAAFATAARGPEGEEGMRAFIEKRKPSWAVNS